jgi:IclR family acetate operon transcriptional repressor
MRRAETATEASGMTPSGSDTSSPAYPISSVENALRLLLLFAEQSEIRAVEASEYLGVARSTAHRLIAMLAKFEFVEQDADTHAYRVGPTLLQIGLSASHNLDLRIHVRPFMERLASETHETAHIGILRGRDLFFIDCIESPQAVKTGSRIGVSYPAHATAGGKVLLAELPRDAFLKLYPNERLETLGPKTIGRRSRLERELENVRERGFATNIGESNAEVTAASAVVRDHMRRARCALTVAAPNSRIDDAQLASLADIVKQVCRAAGSSLP